MTIDGIDAEVAVIRDLTVTGFSTLADMSAEDATFDSITVTDLSVTGPTTATSIEADSITSDVANITDATVGTSTVTVANVGFVTFIDAVGTALTVHSIEAFSGKFDFIEFESGGGGGGGGTGIDSTSVTTQNLMVTGIATFTTGFTTHLTAEGISAGVVTVTDIVSSGVSTLATIKNVDLTVSGVATINHEEVGSSVIGIATITNLDATIVSIDGIDAEVVVTDDLVAGVATITKLEATDTVGTAATFQNLNFVSGVGTHLVLVSEEVGVSTIGILSASDVVITNLIVTGDTNLGVSSGIVIIDGPATISGVVTIGDNSITLDGRQGREYIELGTGSGVRIAGLNTFTNAQSYVEVYNGLFTNLDVSGISTLGSVGVDTLTVSELTVDEITATDAVVGTATITSADIDSASVGFITATDIVATAVTAYKGNFDILEFGEGPSGGGTGIDSTSIQTENLLITGIATINSGIFTSIQSENINVSGTTTSVSIDATTIDTTNLTAEVGAITNLVNGNLVSTGIATLNEVVAGILTVGELDANVIQIDNVDADNAVIGLATITEELVGISTIGFADITDARIGAATITNLTATTIDIDGIDGEVGRLIDLEVTGIATIADLEAGNTRLGITTITGFLDVVGYTTVSGDLTIGGNLQVEGDLSYDEVNGRNANITGVGTVNDLNWTTAVGGALTVTGTSDLAHVDAESLSVSGLSTFVGVATFQDDIYVGGNLYVEGDLAYDEVNGRNANITGVGTVNVLNWNEAVGGALTVTGNSSFDDDVAINANLNVDSINAGLTTAKNLDLYGQNDTATIAGGLTVAKLTTVTDIVGSSGTFTDFTVANLTAGGIEIDGAELDNAEIVNLTVSGIATIAQVEINSGIATLSRLEATDTVGTAATFTNLEVTNINAIGGGTLSIDSITANTGIFTALAVEQLGVTTISVTGFSTFAGDMFVAGVATITTLKVGEIETLGGGGLSVDSIQTGDLNVTGLSTFVGFTTFNDMFVGGAATITNLEVGEITSLGGGSLDVDAIKVTDLEVTGVSTFVGVATFQDDIYIGGNLNIQGDLSYDEVNGRNANITGVGTVNHLNWTTAVGGALTVTGHSDLDSINVGGISTFVGVATFQDDLYVGGNIFIEGDLSYDEVNGRNANITGVGTVNRLYVTTDADVGRNFNAAGISTLNEVNANTLAVGFVTATSAFIGVLTASLIDFSGQGGIGTDDGSTGISSQFIITPNLVVTGITTLNHLNVETVNAGVVTAISFVGMGSELTHLPPASFISTEVPTVRPDGSALQPGDIWFDSDEFRQFTRSAGVGTGSDFWVDSNPTITLPDLQVSNGITTGGVDIALGLLEVQGAARKTVVSLVQTGPSTVPSSVFTVGLATDVQLTNLEVTGVSTFVGVSTFKGDVYIDGNLIIDGDESKDLISGTNLLISGIGTIGTLGVTTDLTVGRNLNVIGIATVGSISAGDITLDDINASGSVSIGGSLTMQPAPTGDGGVYFDNSVVGMGTALIFDSASVGGDLGVGNSLGVVGDAYLDGNIIGFGGTISGYNDIASPLIRANLVSTLEVATNFISAGDAEFVGVITAAGAVAGTLEVLDDASVGRNLSVGGASTFVGNTKTFGEATFKQDVIIEGNLFTAGGGGGISTDGSTGITSTSISTQDLYVSGIATAQTGDILGDLLVRGNARVVGVVTAENFDSLSDRRYKENIRPIENALDKVSDLKGIHFDYKNSGNKSMGLIAQDVQKVFPECVSGKDPISVNYNGIIGALVEAVKELKDQNEQLRKDIDELKKS